MPDIGMSRLNSSPTRVRSSTKPGLMCDAPSIFSRRALEAHADLPSAALLRPSTWDTLFAAETAPVGHIRRILLAKPWKPAAMCASVTVAKPATERAQPP